MPKEWAALAIIRAQIDALAPPNAFVGMPPADPLIVAIVTNLPTLQADAGLSDDSKAALQAIADAAQGMVDASPELTALAATAVPATAATAGTVTP